MLMKILNTHYYGCYGWAFPYCKLLTGKIFKVILAVCKAVYLLVIITQEEVDNKTKFE